MKLVNVRKTNKAIFLILFICSCLLVTTSLYNKIKMIKSVDGIQKILVGFIIPEASLIKIRNAYDKKMDYWFKERNDIDMQENDIKEENDKNEEEKPRNINGKYRIIERHLTGRGIHYENFYVNNKSDIELDVGKYLNRQLSLKFDKNDLPKVLIVHTHTSESFMKEDKEYYDENFYPRSQNEEENVIKVGNSIENKLKENKINVIHSKNYHDYPSYNGSYLRSAGTIKENINNYPSIQIVLDIHRDSMGNNETGKIKPVFNINGRKAAQIMIMTGCDSDKSLNFPNWEHNLSLGLKLQRKVEKMYPGMTRPMYFGNVKYNMHLTKGSLLIEVGTDANSMDEVSYTGELLGNALASLIKELE